MNNFHPWGLILLYLGIFWGLICKQKYPQFFLMGPFSWIREFTKRFFLPTGQFFFVQLFCRSYPRVVFLCIQGYYPGVYSFVFRNITLGCILVYLGILPWGVFLCIWEYYPGFYSCVLMNIIRGVFLYIQEQYPGVYSCVFRNITLGCILVHLGIVPWDVFLCIQGIFPWGVFLYIKEQYPGKYSCVFRNITLGCILVYLGILSRVYSCIFRNNTLGCILVNLGILP